MARFVMHDSEARFTVVRDDVETGNVEFRINAHDATVVLDVGRIYDDVTELAAGLKAAAKELDEMLDDWHDLPDEYDCYVTMDRGGYYVTVEGKDAPANPYPTREVAFYEAAKLMADLGAFPNAWISGEHGPASESCDDQIRAFHDEGGDKVKPLPGVMFEDGSEVLYTTDAVDGEAVEIIRDYGDLGVYFTYYGSGENNFERDHSKFTAMPKDQNDA